MIILKQFPYNFFHSQMNLKELRLQTDQIDSTNLI